ncbi:MAG: protease complex subunit PrcB family protein [Pyrinomonadaceae bacterium]|nr:protease complex subunit PrcB family protein [Pyrinomonadaceae bacterium]MCX7639705.1 protease complex subunit PrcB family protein [Pyrinomonadaceae bacterium]MDW8304607.1 protease complex subunit PrcB family protein [Acidobacteriota bacterium]
MKRLLCYTTLIILASNFVHAQKSRKTRIEKSQKPMNFRILHESNHCGIENPFFFVARDEKTLTLLPLKVDETVDFSKEAVVAVFAGTKPTPGYKIEIKAFDNTVSTKIISPPKDAILAQVLTSPCKIIAVEIQEEKPLLLRASPEWKMNEYSMLKGKIRYSGGFAPREKSYEVEGKIFSITTNGLITINLEIRAKNKPEIKISETVSGKIENDEVYLNRIDPSNFSELPRPMMKAHGKLSNKRVYLKFEPNPTVIIADGFEAEGFIEALRK